MVLSLSLSLWPQDGWASTVKPVGGIVAPPDREALHPISGRVHCVSISGAGFASPSPCGPAQIPHAVSSGSMLPVKWGASVIGHQEEGPLLTEL